MPSIAKKTCPECDAQYARALKPGKRWGCPVMRCRQCGSLFIEHDFVEPAFFMYPFAWLPRIKPGNAVAFVSGIGLMIEAGRSVGNQTDMALFTSSALLLLYFSLKTTFCDRVHGKRSFRQFFQSVKESRMRLENQEYAALLRNSGYQLPSRYLFEYTDTHRI